MVDPYQRRALRVGDDAGQRRPWSSHLAMAALEDEHWIDSPIQSACAHCISKPSGHTCTGEPAGVPSTYLPGTLARPGCKCGWFGHPLLPPGRIQTTSDRTAIPSCDSTRLVIAESRRRTTERPCWGAQLRIPRDSPVPEERQIGLRPIRSATLCLADDSVRQSTALRHRLAPASRVIDTEDRGEPPYNSAWEPN